MIELIEHQLIFQKYFFLDIYFLFMRGIVYVQHIISIESYFITGVSINTRRSHKIVTAHTQHLYSSHIQNSVYNDQTFCKMQDLNFYFRFYFNRKLAIGNVLSIGSGHNASGRAITPNYRDGCIWGYPWFKSNSLFIIIYYVCVCKF